MCDVGGGAECGDVVGSVVYRVGVVGCTGGGWRCVEWVELLVMVVLRV